MMTRVLTNIDDLLIERLTMLARANNTTIEQQAALILGEGVPKRSREDRSVVAASIAALTPKNVSQTTSVILLRLDRDRDSNDIDE